MTISIEILETAARAINAKMADRTDPLADTIRSGYILICSASAAVETGLVTKAQALEALKAEPDVVALLDYAADETVNEVLNAEYLAARFALSDWDGVSLPHFFKLYATVVQTGLMAGYFEEIVNDDLTLDIGQMRPEPKRRAISALRKAA